MPNPTGSNRKPNRNALIAEAVHLRSEGVTYTEIGRRLGIAKATARTYVRLGGLWDRQPAMIQGEDGSVRPSRYFKH